MQTEVAWLVELLAFFAGFFCTVSYLPQVIKTWKERDARSVSLGMYCVMMSGVALWFAVGFLLGSPSMMFWNGLTFVLACSVVVLKIKYSRIKGREKGTWHRSGHSV